jgi:uncharacterized protein (DUF305 family)
MRQDTRVNWISALLLGLFSSTFSSIVSQLSAGRIGRDAYVDWMEVAAIPLHNRGMDFEPTRGIIAAGVAFHQWADISWALFFFGLLGAWTARLSPRALLWIGAPWALLTSSVEWLFLVPMAPFWQPTFTLRQPYWIGFFVHFTSATIYPFFPLIRSYVAGEAPRWSPFLKTWATLAVAGPLALGALAVAGALHREVPHVDGASAYDLEYMRMMSAHHRQGMVLARIAAEQAPDETLRARARLMFAGQAGEIGVMQQWTQSWFGATADAHDHASRPGMLAQDDIERLRATTGASFDPLFVELMSRHHRGAIAMAQDALRRGGDPRIRIFSEGIAHQQCGDIALMHRAEGARAVRIALRSFWLSLRGRIDPQRDCGSST